MSKSVKLKQEEKKSLKRNRETKKEEREKI